MAKAYHCHIFNENRSPVSVFNYNIFNVLKRTNQTLSSYKIGLIGFLDIATTGNTVIALQGRESLPDGKIEASKFLRINSHLILFEMASPGIYFNHTRYTRELPFNYPI